MLTYRLTGTTEQSGSPRRTPPVSAPLTATSKSNPHPIFGHHGAPYTDAKLLICDNYATHKHDSVRAWLDKHPRFHLPFTPTSSSWLNLVERWFRELTDKALRRGVFHSVPDLIAKIEDYLAAHNNDPKPFVWTATAEDILAKVARGRVALQAVNQ